MAKLGMIGKVKKRGKEGKEKESQFGWLSYLMAF